MNILGKILNEFSLKDFEQSFDISTVTKKK